MQERGRSTHSGSGRRADGRSVWALVATLLAGCGVQGEGLDDPGALEEAAGSRSTAFQNGVAPSASYAGTRDTTLAQATPAQNFGAAGNCEVDGDTGGGADSACVLSWQTGAIPAGSIVRTATLQINVTNAAGRAGSTYELYALERSWDESSASWSRASSTTAWQTAGARGANDRASTVLGTVVAGATGRYTVALNAAGVAVVQRWVNNPASNFGFVLANPTTQDGLTFDSSEASTASNRPRLTVTWDPPTSDGGTTSADASRDASSTPTDAGTAPTDSGTAPTDAGTPTTAVDTIFGAAFSPSTDAYFDQLRSIWGGFEVHRSFDGSSGVAPYLNKYQAQDLARGVVSAYSFKYEPAAVSAGTHDAEIRGFFQGIRDDHPVFWTYWHEPDDEIFKNHTFTATAYRNAWRHIRQIADQVRATRPRLKIYATMIIMSYSMGARVAPSRPLTGTDGMYPGDDVIEVFGVDGYNDPALDGQVRDVATQWGPVIDFAQAHHKPWAIGEIGSCVVPGNPQGRATYLRNSFRYFNQRAYRPMYVSYFNVDWSSCDYRMDSDPNAVAVWRQAITQGIGSF